MEVMPNRNMIAAAGIRNDNVIVIATMFINSLMKMFFKAINTSGCMI